MTGASPVNAASQRRADLARRLAQSCPPALADEIALVGSTARGLADDESDLELNLWAEAIPPLDARLNWLRSAGASDLHVEPAPRPDRSYWIGCRIDGIAVEIGWQTLADAERVLSASGERKAPVLADLLISAIPLRTSGRLQAWQEALRAYSDEVQRAAIQAAVERWSPPDHLRAMRRLARRGERLALTQALLDDLDLALRLLYAVSRRWEPSRKWTLTIARAFAPFDLDSRIDAILADPSLERRVDLCARLCLDLLALVPPEYDVSAAAEALKAGESGQEP